eukprot:TRINITY_DN7034_c0_g1_i2.p2 TRINITY_DN7034_c0_g1~~TRINITY_DN7034_c0_g1_i2.p2  ORF type:complete len:315 (+),score=119.49 TRINITY_DN7034_c0_g1_i2:115-1059(+)
MAAALAISMPTSLGTREVVDLNASSFNLQRLEQPNICLHQCGTKYGPQLVRAIFEKLDARSLKSTFEEINLNDNKIGDEGAKFLSEGLAGNKAIKKLYLARCDMTSAGFKAVGKVLADAPALEEVVLSGNVADKDGLEGEFSEGLKKNKNLKSLYLGVLRLGNEGIKPLCQGPLKVHQSLQHLSLTYNRIDAGGVAFLNEFLKANVGLKYLDLSGNSLGPEGAKALVEGLNGNSGRLEKLSVAQNVIRFEGAKALAQFFASGPGSSMEFLDLRHNSVTFKGFQDLRKVLKREGEEEIGCWLMMFGKRQLFVNAH